MRSVQTEGFNHFEASSFFSNSDFVVGVDTIEGENIGLLNGNFVIYDYGNFGFSIFNPDLQLPND